MEAIKEVAKRADIVFLCLPDAASKEIMASIGELPCKVIDTSTAFRTAADWSYGFPELGTDYKKGYCHRKTHCKPRMSREWHDCLHCALIKANLVPTDYPSPLHP